MSYSSDGEDFNGVDNIFGFKPLEMAKRAVKEHDSPIGHYVVFKQYIYEERIDESLPHLVKALTGNHPYIKLDLTLWMTPVDMPEVRYLIKTLSEKCPEFAAFANQFFRKLFDKPKGITLAGALGPDDEWATKEQLDFLTYFSSGRFDKAWEIFEKITVKEPYVAESMMLVMSNNNMFWLNINPAVPEDGHSNEATLATLVNFREQCPLFNDYIKTKPTLLTYINKDYLAKRISLMRYEAAVKENNIEVANRHLNFALENYELSIVAKAMCLISYPEKNTKNLPGYTQLDEFFAHNPKAASFTVTEYSNLMRLKSILLKYFPNRNLRSSLFG